MRLVAVCSRGGTPKASTSPKAAPPRRRPPEPEPGAPAPEVVRRGGVEIVFYPGPLPRLGDEPLSQAELDFRWLIAGEVVPDGYGDRVEVRPEHHRWCERARVAWERDNVFWFHGYADGKPVWRRERPPPDVTPPPPSPTADKSSRERARFRLRET